MNALGHVPDEYQIAECVIAGQPLPHAFVAAAHAEYAGIAMLDLGPEARAEAVRIAAARALVTPADTTGAELRPVIARVRRHRGARPLIRPHSEATGEEVAPVLGRAERFWLFRLLFIAADGRLLWESFLSLAAGAAPKPGRSSAAMRLLLDPDTPDLRHVTTMAREEQLESVRLVLRQPLELWRAREHAIVEAIRARHARLSAGLLQLALFDRREERMAAAQSALLDDALSASATRLNELAGWEHLRVESCQLVFGVALE